MVKIRAGSVIGTAGPQPCKATYTVDEAAGMLGVSRNSAYQAARAGELPVIRIGKRLLVPRHAFEKMLAGNPTPRKPEAA
jgi:excisionase family DNA binding protein